MIRLIVLLMLLGCGKEETINNYYSMYPEYYNNFSPEVREYVAQFEQDSAVFNNAQFANGVTIKVVDGELTPRDPKKPLPPLTVGVCYRYSDGRRDIELKGQFLNSQSNITKKSLIYHELGHCVMGRGHNDTTFESKCGSTFRIMKASIPDNFYLTRCWQGMLEDFFQPQVMALHEDDCHKTEFGDQCYTKKEGYSFMEIVWGIITWAFVVAAYAVVITLIIWLLFD